MVSDIVSRKFIKKYKISANHCYINKMGDIINKYLSSGGRSKCCIKKTREKYLYKDKYEISFDDVKDLGLFMEIEIVKHTKNKDEEYQDLINLLYDLDININQISNKHYPEYFIKAIDEK